MMVKKPTKSSPVDTALAGILGMLQDDLVYTPLGPNEVSIPHKVGKIRAILEALVEDVRGNLDTERKARP